MCVACNQKTKNEAESKIFKEAIQLAKQTGLWVGVYTDGKGKKQFIRADLAAGYPVERYFTPDMQLA